MKNRFEGKSWYPYTITACIAVAFYVILNNLGVVRGAVSTFLGYFSSVIIGAVLAYLMNPLAKLFRKRLFGFIKNEKLKWTFSVILAVVAMILVLGFMLGTLIPQLANSIFTLVNNMDTYMTSLQKFIDDIGLSSHIDLSNYMSSSGSIGSSIKTFLKSNANDILNASASTAKRVANWMIALILAVYMLMAKDSIKNSTGRLLKTLMPQKSFRGFTKFLSRCDRILVQYITYSLLEAVIVGIVNALFMKICGMQYIGLISLVVAITNLIPTFGPIIGGLLGAFILLLVKPWHALVFIIFTFVLQFFDGYILKPKLFGNSLGVSGLLILIAVIVFGKMFGVVGILLAIPAAAILYFIYQEGLIPALERRRAKLDNKADA